jgi:hypothetical protein
MSHNISRNQQQNAALMWIKFAKTEKAQKRREDGIDQTQKAIAT